MTHEHMALQVQKYFVWLVYPVDTGINLKLKLFTDNLSPSWEKLEVFFNLWLHIDNKSWEFWKPATGQLAPGA